METLSKQFISPTGTNSKSAINSLLRPRYLRTIAKLYGANDVESTFKPAWDFIEGNLECLTEAKELVFPGLGRLTQAGLNSEHGVLQTTLLMAALGGQGSCNLQLSLNHTVYFDCHLIDLHSSISLNASSDRVTITCECDGERDIVYDFVKLRGNWRRVDSPSDGIYDAHSFAINLFNNDNASVLDERVTAIFQFSKSPLSDISNDLGRALALIEEHAPEYIGWIGNILRAIVFLGPTDGSTISHSSELRPGLIAISHPIDIPHFAAQLVHECAHQYFFVYQHEYVLTDFASETLYASPLREEARPLVLALLALHASVNIRKLVKQGLAGGVRSGYFESELVVMDEGIRRSTDSMNDSPDFTKAGLEFFQDIIRV